MKLKLCPFCGAEAVLKETYWKVHGSRFTTRYKVGCFSPSCRGFVHDYVLNGGNISKKVAIRKWNMRIKREAKL